MYDYKGIYTQAHFCESPMGGTATKLDWCYVADQPGSDYYMVSEGAIATREQERRRKTRTDIQVDIWWQRQKDIAYRQSREWIQTVT